MYIGMEATQRQPKLTMRQARVAEVLASGRADSITHAAELAKVHRSTVHRLQHSTTALAKIEQLKQARSDKARDLKQLSAAKIRAKLDNDPSDMLVLGAYKTANDVLASGIEEQQDEVDHGALARQIRTWLRHARRYGYAASAALLTTRYGG